MADTRPDRRCRRCGAASGLRMLPLGPLTLAGPQWECSNGCPVTDLDLDAIEARTNAATDGPWTTGEDGLVWPPHMGDPVSGSIWLPDSRFIAAARTDVPALIAEARRLRAELAWHTDGPGPDVSVVYDRDGDEWVRRLDQWSCEGDGQLIRWGRLVAEWGPLTAEPKAEIEGSDR